jgi:hypothetical protein
MGSFAAGRSVRKSVGCWLLKRGIAADGEEALELIRKARLHDERLRHHPSHETGKQRGFVEKWVIWRSWLPFDRPETIHNPLHARIDLRGTL